MHDEDSDPLASYTINTFNGDAILCNRTLIHPKNTSQEVDLDALIAQCSYNCRSIWRCVVH